MAEEGTILWFAGVDWGSERHQVCLLDAGGTTLGEREFPHSGEGLAELGDWLLSMASAASQPCYTPLQRMGRHDACRSLYWRSRAQLHLGETCAPADWSR